MYDGCGGQSDGAGSLHQWSPGVTFNGAAGAGLGDSIGYFDSAQFEQAASPTEYMFLPISTLQTAYNTSGHVYRVSQVPRL